MMPTYDILSAPVDEIETDARTAIGWLEYQSHNRDLFPGEKSMLRVARFVLATIERRVTDESPFE